MRTLALSLILVFSVHVPAARSEALQAGAARVDITPPLGHPLWGYAARHDSPSTAVNDPLLARAIVLSAGKSRIAIVSLDLGRPPTRASVTAIRNRVRTEAGIDAVFLVASHTHNGPVLELDTWPREGKPYTRQLDEKLVAVIVDAARSLRPARLGHVSTSVTLNRNRHSQRKDREPRDREFLVVRIDEADGKPLAHLVNFAAHPTLTDSKSHAISADFPGVLARLVEKELGGVCLFLQGAAGDLSPNPSGAANAEAFGTELGRLAITQSKKVRSDLVEVSSLKVRERDFTFGKRVDLSNPVVRTAYSLAFFPELIHFYEREYQGGIRPHLTTALLDGRIGFVGVSGEFFCEHANRLRRRAGLDALLFLGYCNDYHQYFPTIEAAAQGGYGADAMVSPIEIGAGERVMDQALIDLLQLQGKLRR
jgi:neutral ceramidase